MKPFKEVKKAMRNKRIQLFKHLKTMNFFFGPKVGAYEFYLIIFSINTSNIGFELISFHIN